MTSNNRPAVGAARITGGGACSACRRRTAVPVRAHLLLSPAGTRASNAMLGKQQIEGAREGKYYWGTQRRLAASSSYNAV
jgi:hypothetical protein